MDVVYVGVDPGVRGAVAQIWPDGCVVIAPLPRPIAKRVALFRELAELIRSREYAADLTIEKPQAYPLRKHTSAGNPKVTETTNLRIMLAMGIGYGELLAAIGAAGITRCRPVLPQTWKATMCKGLPKGKKQSIWACRIEWPDIDLTRSRGVIDDDNYADAVMLAAYGRAIDAPLRSDRG